MKSDGKFSLPRERKVDGKITASSVGSRKLISRVGTKFANPNATTAVASATPVKPSAGAVYSSATPAIPIIQTSVSSVVVKNSASSATASKPHGKDIVSSSYLRKQNIEDVMFFKDVTLGSHEVELCFRLIHFWEARNPVSK